MCKDLAKLFVGFSLPNCLNIFPLSKQIELAIFFFRFWRLLLLWNLMSSFHILLTDIIFKIKMIFCLMSYVSHIPIPSQQEKNIVWDWRNTIRLFDKSSFCPIFTNDVISLATIFPINFHHMKTNAKSSKRPIYWKEFLQSTPPNLFYSKVVYSCFQLFLIVCS